jgi:hypothetical protein
MTLIETPETYIKEFQTASQAIQAKSDESAITGIHAITKISVALFKEIKAKVNTFPADTMTLYEKMFACVADMAGKQFGFISIQQTEFAHNSMKKLEYYFFGLHYFAGAHEVC